MESRRIALRDVSLIVAGCIALLIACGTVTGIGRIRALTDNDAVGYTAAARSLAETGHLTSHVIYPSVLGQHTTKSVLYMPGYYAALALSYKLFGFGAWQSLLVSWVGYVAAACCTYLVGRKLYGRAVGLVACGLMMVYPPDLYYAMTAMQELAIAGAAMAAIAAAVYLPRRWVMWGVPLLLVLPFIFRETTAFLVIPMTAIVMRADGPWSRAAIGRGLLAAGLSVVVLGAVFVSPISAGRPSLLKLNVFLGFRYRGSAVYSDAASDLKLHPTGRDWVRAASLRLRDHTQLLTWRLRREPPSLELTGFLPLLLVTPILLVWGSVRRDAICLSTGLMLLCTFIFIGALYTVRADRALRVSMYAGPLAAIGLASIWHAAWKAAERRRWMLPTSVALGMFFIVLCGLATFRSLRTMIARDSIDQDRRDFANDLKHDDGTVLVAPAILALPYLRDHYPVYVSMVPTNPQTLAMLCARWPVTTVITDWHFDAQEMRPKDLNDLGLSWQKQIEFNHQRFDVFRRSADPKDVREAPEGHNATTRSSGRSRKRGRATGP